MTDDDDDCSERVAALKQLARETKAVLNDIERGLGGMRSERRSGFRCLSRLAIAGFIVNAIGFGVLIAALAHGFHWI